MPLAALLLLPALLANDAAVGGTGAGSFPVERTDVRLVRELVVFQEAGDAFQVTADLHFRNDGPEAVTLQLGFPARARGDWEGDPVVHDFAVWVDGQPAAVHRVEVGPATSQEDWWEEVFLFEARFPARADVQILHSYRLTQGVDVMGTRFTEYVLRTGRGWAGRVGEARFSFRFARPPAGLKVRAGDEDLPLDARTARGGRPAIEYVAGPSPSLELVYRDFEPEGDVWVTWGGDPWWALPTRADPEEVEVPCAIQLMTWYRDLGEPASRARPLPDAALLACYDPTLLRNLLYAARGYDFEKPQWKKTFADLFPTSALPFDAAWIGGVEKLAIDALQGVEAP